jgi:hypothetical protein
VRILGSDHAEGTWPCCRQANGNQLWWRSDTSDTDVDRPGHDSRWRSQAFFFAGRFRHRWTGFCFDRFPAARVAALTLAISGLGVGVIVVARSRTVLALATILLGAAFGADTDVLPRLVSLKSYGEFLGYFLAAGTLGLAGGAFFMGRVFDVYHPYILMINIIAAASIVAAALVYLLPKTTEMAVPQGP